MKEQADEREVAQIHTADKWGVRIQTQSVVSTGSELLLPSAFEGSLGGRPLAVSSLRPGLLRRVGFPRGLRSLQLSPS